jgi:hypothetical protein
MITECGFGNKLNTIRIYFITLCEYSMLKNNRGQSKFSIKVLWSCKPALKTLGKTFDGLWWELTNRTSFQSRSYVNKAHELEKCSIYFFSFQVYAQQLRSLKPIYTIKAFVKNMVKVFDGIFAERKLCQSLSHLHDQNLCKVCFVRPHKFGSPSHHFSNSCALCT